MHMCTHLSIVMDDIIILEFSLKCTNACMFVTAHSTITLLVTKNASATRRVFGGWYIELCT
jgi:hypothetical protein